MKQQTGWVKCPMCEGSGEVETEASKLAIGRFNDAFNYELKNSVLVGIENVDYGVRPQVELEPCPTCKDQEFKGCLPVYGEKLILNACKSCNDLFESVDKSDTCEHCNGEGIKQ